MITLPGYQILTQIYESINSKVYRAIREQDNRAVILKVLKEDYPTPNKLTQYKQEYEITRNLNLDGVVKAFALLPYERTLVIILEDFGASSLQQLMNEPVGVKHTPPLSEFLSIAIKTAQSLGNIHTANVIHKDINPSNIVYNPETETLKIIDFGISTVLTRENPILKNPNVLEGTLAYMSPEQTGRMNRTLDYRTDFYSLGVTFYELLTGQLPFETTDVLELVHCHIAKQPVPPHQLLPEIPKVVSEIVMKLMAKTAESRYQSAWGVKADLEECLAQLQENGNVTDFPLAALDISDKFQIPQKLYGREAEVETLLTAFERVAREGVRSGDGEWGVGENSQSKIQNPKSKIELMLVAGYSGIGKSSLVAEIHKPNTRLLGYFTEGKFDQFQRNIPYSAIVSAFKGLVRQILSESEAQLNLWREQLLVALGPNGQVIIDVIPEVELIVGKQLPVPELGATESQNRFNFVFQNFIRAFCSKEHPLVIFLDDLQWADSATLKLIELMMTDTDMQYLFLIGAYRDNEVSPTHPLIMTLEGLRNLGATINSISLAPLALENISQLIADTLHSDAAGVKPLAELVNQKTEGNPFFVNQFMKNLHAENLITFNLPNSVTKERSKRKFIWQWDIAQIEAQNISENVVELMIGKLKKLPEFTQQILCLASCVGASFDLKTISIISKKSASEVYSDLTAAIQAGLILSTSELDEELLIQNYKFLHDRVQQAAYTLINEERKTAVHLQIGRLLLQNTAPSSLLEEIFEIVDHLNLGVELVTQQQERVEIARLNLMAGQKAKAATAYGAALEYFNAVLKLLSADSWQTSYDLTLALYQEAVEAAYLNGDFEQMQLWAEIVLQQAKTLIDKVKVYEVKIQTCVAKSKQLEAVKIGLQALELMGIEFPKQPSMSDVQLALKETASHLTGKQPSDLINLPEMTDRYKLASMKLLVGIVPAAYQAAPTLYLLILLQQINISVKYGNSPLSAFAYVGYATVLCSVVGDIEAGYQFGQLSLNVLSRFNAKALKAKIFYPFNAFVRHCKEHVRTTLKSLVEGSSSGVETGDLVFAAFCASRYCHHSYFIGKELCSLEGEMTTYCSFMEQIQQKVSLNYTKIYRQTVLNLLGQAEDPCILIGSSYNEETMLKQHLLANERFGIGSVYINKFILCYLFEVYPQAVENATIANQYLDGLMGTLLIPLFHLYDSLAGLAVYADAAAPEQEGILNKVRANQEKMQKWAHHAPMNHLHKFYLVEAERYRVLGQYIEAMDYYDKAIAGAKENEYINEEALAYELAAKFYMGLGKEIIARTYMSEAHYAYTRWGAKAKLEDLEAKYPQLLPKLAATKSITSTSTITTNSTTGSQSGEALDLATFMKASQAISSEIVLDKLLASLMKILIQNAGAQTGFLILDTAGKWVVEASGEMDADDVKVLQSIPVNQYLPESIVNYVTRTKETVVENDAAQQGKFTLDPYIKANKTKSILCAPLINQGQLSGIVYLENNLTEGAFTPDRLEVIQLLSGQAAIAITNATLYAEVTASERRLTQFLEAMPIGVSVHDATGQLYYANQSSQKLLGINALPEAKTAQLSQAYHIYQAGTQQLYPNAQLPIARSLCGEQVKVDDIEIHQPDKIVPLEVFSTPILDETGKIVYAIAAFQDITKRKQAEKLIAEYNRTLELQVASRTQELAQTLDHLKATQEELIQSEKMAALGQLIAGVAHEINTPLGAIRSSIGNISEFLTNNIEKFPTFFQNLSPERQEYFLSLLSKSSQQISLLSTKEKRLIKKDLQRQLKQQEIDNADTIAATLVNIGVYDDIQAFLPLLKDPHSETILKTAYDWASVQKSTRTIATATDRAAKVVFALKSYARYDHSGHKVQANIIEGIETVLTLYHNQFKQGVEVIRNYGEVPSIGCYPDELNQVWTNLVHNALQAMDYKGSLKIDVQQQDATVIVSMTDSGKGIPLDIMSKIFEPFFTTKPPGEGSGLGLDIVRKIIEKHGGKIEVESLPGKTTFTVLLPICF